MPKADVLDCLAKCTEVISSQPNFVQVWAGEGCWKQAQCYLCVCSFLFKNKIHECAGYMFVQTSFKFTA